MRKDVNREYGPKRELIYVKKEIEKAEMLIYRAQEYIKHLKRHAKLLERELKKELGQ